MANKLFDADCGWDNSKICTLPNLPNLKNKRYKNSDGMHKTNKKTFSTIHRDVTSAVLGYTGYNGSLGNTLYGAGHYAIVQVADDMYAAERELADGTREVVSYNKNGELKAAVISPTGRYSSFPGLGSKKEEVDVTTIFLAILPALAEIDEEVCERLNRITSGTGSVECDYYYLSDAMYQHITYCGDLPANIPSDGNIDLLTKRVVESGALDGELITGTKHILGGKSNILNVTPTVTMKQARDEFAAFADSREWSDEECMLIPQFPDDFPVPEESLKMARRYVNTGKDVRPMRNFMWRGITFYGKSTGVEVMACMLNIPLLRMTCHSNMETQQFLSDFVPDTSDTADLAVPDIETMLYAPDEVYYELTGIENDDATPEMCLKAYGELAAKQNSSSPRFKHVESNYVRALTHGYIIEIQECSRIKDSGVLVGLNEYDRPGAVIPLIDGSFAKRHPDAMVVMTDNVGYESCRHLDPSVLRRMAFIIDSYEMPKKTILERIRYNTKYNDTKVLDSCYKLWKDIKEYCQSHDITEGPVSVTELEILVQCIKFDGLDNVKDNVIDCIISKATSDAEEQQDIIKMIETNANKYGLF